LRATRISTKVQFRAVCGVVLLSGMATFSRALDAQSLAPKRTLASNAPQGCAAVITPISNTSASSDDAETRRLISAAQEASLQGEHQAARDAFAQAAKRSPTNAMLAYYLGREHEFLSASTEAVKEYCRYLQLSPNARDKDEVQGRIVRLVPASQLAQVDEAKANFSSGVALLERRQYTAADSIFGSIAARLPNAPEPYYNRALSRAARGERALATQDFQKYLDLTSNPTDRGAINAAVARMQDRVFGSGQALGSGLALPGLGQMSTGRPFLGVAVLGAVVGAAIWGMSEEQGFEIATFEDPFGNPYVDSLPRTTRPNFVIAATAAGALWVGSAYEAMNYARRSRARAESIIQIGVPATSRNDHPEPYLAVGLRSVGAGVRFRLP
jgi:tetratricopeptide (TPR) repeat protein